MPLIPVLGRQRQAALCEFKASPGYRVRACLKDTFSTQTSNMRIMLMRISVADGNALETTASSSEDPFNAQLHPYSFGRDKPQERHAGSLCSEELPCGSIDSTTDTL